MVVIEGVETRDDLVRAMLNLSEDAGKLRRRGHEGKHLSCFHCDRLAMLHANLDAVLTSHETAV